MKTLLTLIALFALSSCFSRSAIMTRMEFDNIQMGDKIEDIESVAGTPYNICSKGDNTFEYEYVERIEFTGKTDIYENHYILIVSDGVVTGKRYSTSKSPAYNLIYQDDPNATSY